MRISVVVAVYNIAPYLKRCVDSIRRQTYRNLEIILVDDGSTDESGVMCDQFAAEDDRIKVIHKPNGGLSDARNAGTEKATGEYIAYVDGDDWIDDAMYEYMLAALEQYQADVAVCRYRCIYPNHTEDNSTDKLVLFEGREALRAYTEEDERYQIQNAAWNKLYRREFTHDLHFPKGKWYEDIVYTAKLLAQSKRTVYLDHALYNYVLQREGSIMNAGINERVLTEQIPAYFERADFLRGLDEPELVNTHNYFLYKRMLLMYTAFVRKKCSGAKEKRERKENLRQLKKLIKGQRGYFDDAYACAVANPNEKKKMDIFLCSPTLFNAAMWLNDKYVIPYKQKQNLYIVRMIGGLGNQMFQYALYCQLKAQGKNVRLEDESEYQQDDAREKHLQKAFGIVYDRPTRAEWQRATDSSRNPISRVRRKLFGRKSKIYTEKQFNFDSEVFTQPPVCFEGYWQSEKYFEGVKDKLRQDFTFRCTIPEETEQVLQKIESVMAVSVHVRRGDYLQDAQSRLYGNICTDVYYAHAMTMMREKVPGAQFFVFTNDPEWVKAHMQGADITVVDCNDESTGYFDMMLMSHCRHHIIANSSFSWWGAWLNPRPDKIVIAPPKWLNGQDCRDIYTKECVICER